MPFRVDLQHSSLSAEPGGFLKVHILQMKAGLPLEGRRHELERAQGPFGTQEDVQACRALVEQTLPNALNVISYHRGMIGCVPELQELSRSRTIVTLAGIEDWTRNGTLTNDAFIAMQGRLQRHTKISLSSEDQQGKVCAGDELRIFSPAVNENSVCWAVLNCHDYTHADIIAALLKHQIEILVVVTYNTATRLYWEYAVSDIHRLFCYIVIVNVGELGGSGVFAPFRRIGRERNASIGAGGQVFATRGPSEIGATIELDLCELRRLRETFRNKGFEADYEAHEDIGPITAVVPSEHFMTTVDRQAGVPPVHAVRNIRTTWGAKKIRVAVAQLNSMAVQDYVETRYRIRNHENCKAFLEVLDLHLSSLKRRCKLLERMPSGAHLDMLVLPEVFVPRPYLKKLQRLCNELGTTAICGIDYPDGGEETNANECAILRPRKKPVYYRKITRSQYDAWRTPEAERMPLNRGDTLYRFVNADGHGFGVLICYDFSHFDLIHKINLQKRTEPLDALFVVAHNPFGILYRSCCIADAHRFYQYVIMSNVSTFGGSGVFAPQRTSGARQTIVEIGKGTEAIALAELDLRSLREARNADDNALHKGNFIRRPGLFQIRESPVSARRILEWRSGPS
ncbi:hypothetical protein [Bradyrhizobium japonicum]|uniref:hypothetical protein n=1 Tax=Bradyrhizobium japonicum TaxID=375 RepID=UPI00200E7575|nr:hypothetical protein [Bradyrhizobium japonicum]UQE03541.1 hypothetical protein JEY30_47205 [Bradyrhizobium japonicum]